MEYDRADQGRAQPRRQPRRRHARRRHRAARTARPTSACPSHRASRGRSTRRMPVVARASHPEARKAFESARCWLHAGAASQRRRPRGRAPGAGCFRRRRGRRADMELHERLRTQRPTTVRARPVRRAQEPGPPVGHHRARPAALPRGRSTPRPCALACVATIRAELATEQGLVARRSRAAGRGDRRRHARPRPDREAAGRPDDHRDHGQRPVRGLDRARRPARADAVRFNDDSHLRRIINRIVAQIGRRIDEASPMVDARLPDGSRVNAIIPPLSLSGPLVTIRKFTQNRLALSDFVQLGTLTPEAVEFLDALRQGGAQHPRLRRHRHGKTTLLNAMSASIPDDERIVTIEDAAELRLNQRHVLRLESRPANIEGEGEITIRDLVRNSLRMRPDRIIVGEVRGAEALDMLQAMNTGHDGSLTTLHANTPARRAGAHRDDGADGRLRPAGAGDPPAGRLGARPDRPPRAAAGRLAPRHVDHRGPGHGDRRRHAAGHLRRSATRASTPSGRVSGQLEPTGLRPSFSRSLARHGLSLAGGAVRRPRRSRSPGGRAMRRVACSARRRRGTALLATAPARAAPTARLTPSGGATFPDRSYVLTLPGRRRADTDAISVSRERRAGQRACGSGRPDARFAVVLAIDASSSMRGRPIRGAMAAARAFAAQRPAGQAARRRHLQRQRQRGACADDRRERDRPGARRAYRRLAAADADLRRDRGGAARAQGPFEAGAVVVLSDGHDIGSATTPAQSPAARRATTRACSPSVCAPAASTRARCERSPRPAAASTSAPCARDS